MNKVLKGLVWFGHEITKVKFSVVELAFYPFLLLLMVAKPLVGALVMLGFLMITTFIGGVFEAAYEAMHKGENK